MKMKRIGLALLLGFLAVPAWAQDRASGAVPGAVPGAAPDGARAGGHEPPPRAYEDCKGKKAGDTVQHTTPEGKVAALCVDSPKGLVARPIRGKDSESKGKGAPG